MINGKKITGNKKLLEVLVFVRRKINIPNDNNPKLVTKLNIVRLNKI